MSALARLDADAADKLAKVCRLFSSDHVGERATAAATAPIPTTRGDRARTGTWRENLVLAVRWPGDLTPWERGFVESMRTRLSASPKQKLSLAEIAARLRARGRV